MRLVQCNQNYQGSHFEFFTMCCSLSLLSANNTNIFNVNEVKYVLVGSLKW
uniref:Uncharacterized protein n=1 Tax=Rhizophora mucronata TaxID=61149 RepID=A0A2P2N6U4_RHIMU